MALVAYDNSDSSEYEDESDDKAPVVLLNHKPQNKSVPEISHNIRVEKPEVSETKPETTFEEPTKTIKEEDPQESRPSLFNFLPQPSKKKLAVIEEDDEFLYKKEVVKPRAKITVPSLNDFKDVENSTPIAKPRAANGKKSGLLSMLPQPRNGMIATTKSLIPHVLTKKPTTSVTFKKENVPSKKPKVDSASLTNDSDDSDNEEVQNDFFSIHKPVEVPDIVPLDLEPNIKNEVVKTERPRGIESYFKKEEVDNMKPEYHTYSMEQQSEASSSHNSYGAGTANIKTLELDEEAIMKLCGTRGKRRREEIQIVDVNQQEVLADAKEMLLKGLMDDTTKRMSASKKKGNEPTTQQRRKHQITYLAHQAKANEAELQNQWANNRMSKRQTQAKYGF